MLVEQQIAERQDRAKATALKVLKRPKAAHTGITPLSPAAGRPIGLQCAVQGFLRTIAPVLISPSIRWGPASISKQCCCGYGIAIKGNWRSEEHTSELQ